MNMYKVVYEKRSGEYQTTRDVWRLLAETKDEAKNHVLSVRGDVKIMSIRKMPT